MTLTYRRKFQDLQETLTSLQNFLFHECYYSDVETNLPPDLKEDAVLCFEAAVANRMNIGDAIKKVEDDVLSKCNEEFKGKRFKGFIKFNYDSNVISIQVYFSDSVGV